MLHVFFPQKNKMVVSGLIRLKVEALRLRDE